MPQQGQEGVPNPNLQGQQRIAHLVRQNSRWLGQERPQGCCMCHVPLPRAATGPCGGGGRRAGSVVFFVWFGAEGVRAGSRGCVMPDLKRWGSLSGQRFYPLPPGEPTRPAAPSCPCAASRGGSWGRGKPRN